MLPGDIATKHCQYSWGAGSYVSFLATTYRSDSKCLSERCWIRLKRKPTSLVKMLFYVMLQLPNLYMTQMAPMSCHCGRCSYGSTERAGGAVMVSGIVSFEDCILAGNEARRGSAIYNAVTVSLKSTDVCANHLLCDDSTFLDWNNVSGPSTGRRGGDGYACGRVHTEWSMF